MKINALEAIPIAIPLNHPLKMAVATVTKRDSLIVRIHTDEGLVGLGEAVIAPYFSGETQMGAKAAVDQLFAPVLIGMDVFDLNANLRKLDRVLFGNPSVKSAIDVAMHDLLARAMNIPLYKLLGGKVREKVNTTWAVSAEEPQRVADEALEGLAQGFQAIKIKVGACTLQTDIERVNAVCIASGGNAHLRVDANQAWSPKLAIHFLKAVAGCHVQFIEQPVSRRDIHGMAQVARAVDTPVAPDEGLFDAQDALLFIKFRAADGVVMKLMKAGGIAGCRKLASVIQAGNLDLHLGGMPGETSISAAAEVHLAVSLPELGWDAGIYPHAIQQDVVTERLQAVNGAYLPSETPGLGIELDEDALARCRTDR